MIVSKKVLVAVEKDNQNNVVRVLDVLNVDEKKAKELKTVAKQSNENVNKITKEKERTIDSSIEQASIKHQKSAYALAKVLFNDYVERGYFKTNDEFENMYYNYIVNGREFDIKLAPTEYKNILGRLL